MSEATPTTAAMDTRPTPRSSPHIIHSVRFTPTVIPNVIERVMHIPGVAETKKKVGIKRARLGNSTIGAMGYLLWASLRGILTR